MDRNGYDTSRRLANKGNEPYRGYYIVKITSKKHHWSNISRKFLDSIESTTIEYAFTKSDILETSQYSNCTFNSMEDCKWAIDHMIDYGTIYLTNEENEKWVHTPNRKCGWSYNYKSLANVLKGYKKADKRRREGYILMLEDANFREYSGLLMDEKYDDFLSLAESEFPFDTEVTITISSSAVELKIGENMAKELKELVDDFLEKKREKGAIKKYAHVSKVVTSNEGTLFNIS